MKLYLLLACFTLSLAVENPLQGVWIGKFNNAQAGQVNCEILAQFLPLDYLAIIKNCENPNANGVSMGIYFLGATQITVTFAGSYGAGGVPGDYIDVSWEIDSQGKLTLAALDGSWTELYNKAPSQSYDGVWSGQSVVNGSVVADAFVELWSGTYLSFPKIYGSNYGAFIGTAIQNNTNMPVYYALTNTQNEQIIGTTVQTDFAQTTNPQGWSLDHAPYTNDPVQQWKFSTIARQSESSVLQGVWIGYTAGCTTTLDFRANLFRVFQTACSSSGLVGMHFGVWSSSPNTGSGMTSLTLYYAYSTFGLEGTNATYPITILQGNTNFRLTIDAVDYYYYQVATQATTIILKLTLSGDMSAFPTSEITFVDELSAATNIDTTLILIRGVENGPDSSSFYVTVQFSDDPATGAKASDVENIIKGQTYSDFTVEALSVLESPYTGFAPRTFGSMNIIVALIMVTSGFLFSS